MTIRLFGDKLAAIFTALLSSGCVVVPMHIYVADAGAGMPVYERCSLTPELPMGVKVQRRFVGRLSAMRPGVRR